MSCVHMHLAVRCAVGCVQVKRLLTRPLGRPPAPLRKVAIEQPGAGHNIVPPPELQENKVRAQVPQSA